MVTSPPVDKFNTCALRVCSWRMKKRANVCGFSACLKFAKQDWLFLGLPRTLVAPTSSLWPSNLWCSSSLFVFVRSFRLSCTSRKTPENADENEGFWKRYQRWSHSKTHRFENASFLVPERWLKKKASYPVASINALVRTKGKNAWKSMHFRIGVDENILLHFCWDKTDTY